MGGMSSFMHEYLQDNPGATSEDAGLAMVSGMNQDQITSFKDMTNVIGDYKSTAMAQTEPENTLSEVLSNHPDWSYEQILAYMAKHSEEWAEKYLDYLTEKGELTQANEYTANREDTAYQRLVADLRQAGLNPAMMYGGSANISAGGSQGYIKMTEGANSRQVNNYSKVQQLLLAYMTYQMKMMFGSIKSVNDFGRTLASFFK